MKFRILYFPEPVDCTSDPHYLSYASEKEMMKDVLKVCESDLVKQVLFTTCYDEKSEVTAESDQFTTYAPSSREPKLISGLTAEKHKISGLYFYRDATRGLKLPPGLTGVKYIHEHLEKLLELGTTRVETAVVWAYFGDHNCSDYIIANFETLEVNYCNQDWYRDFHPRAYQRHLKELARILGVDFSELLEE